MSSTTLVEADDGSVSSTDGVGGRRVLAALALLSLAAGFVHAAVIDAHRGHGLAAWAFGATAVFQVAWAALIHARPSRTLLTLGAAVNAAVLGGWLLSRTVGIGFLEGFEESEAVGFSDAVASGAELLLVVGAVLFVLAPGGLLRVAGRFGGAALGIVGVAAVVLAVPAVSQGGSFHDHGQGHADVAAGAHGAHDAHDGEAQGHDAQHESAAGDGHADHDGAADHDSVAHDEVHEDGKVEGHVESATGTHQAGHSSDSHPAAHAGPSDHTGPAGAHLVDHADPSDHTGPSAHAHPVTPAQTGPSGHAHPVTPAQTEPSGHAHPVTPAQTEPSGHAHPVTPAPVGPHRPTHPALPSGVTAAQQAAADALLAETEAVLPQWSDDAKVEAAGFRTIGDAGTGTEHLVNWNWLDDGVVLDPNRPESLVYRITPEGRELAAAMFMLPLGTADQDVPDVGGTLTQWHVHEDLCFAPERMNDGHPQRLLAGSIDEDGGCSRGEKLARSPMLHVWIVEHPCGPFASLEGVGAGQAIVEAEDPDADPNCQHSAH